MTSSQNQRVSEEVNIQEFFYLSFLKNKIFLSAILLLNMSILPTTLATNYVCSPLPHPIKTLCKYPLPFLNVDMSA